VRSWGLSSFVRHGSEFARPLQRALRDTMWETCGVVRDQAGLRRGLDRVAELRGLAGQVDVRPPPKAMPTWPTRSTCAPPWPPPRPPSSER
jgi:succinate dehydrogenase/fumarate reductase flavoprotein subunit